MCNLFGFPIGIVANREPFLPAMSTFYFVFSREVRTYILMVLRKLTPIVAIIQPVIQVCSKTTPTSFRVFTKSQEN